MKKNLNTINMSKFKKVEGITDQCWDLLSFAIPGENKPNILLAACAEGVYQIIDQKAPFQIFLRLKLQISGKVSCLLFIILWKI